MKSPIKLILELLFASIAASDAAEPGDAVFAQRRDAALSNIQKNPSPDPEKNADFKQHMALLLLFKNEKVDEANRMVLAYCGGDKLTTYVGKLVPKNRCEAVLRIYLMERTHKLLSKEAREAIEDFAWELLTKYPGYDDVVLKS